MDKSTISHLGYRLDLLACQTIGQVEVVGYYYCLLVFENLTMEGQKAKTYGEGVVQVTAESSRKWANDISKKIVSKDESEQKLWIVPALFYVMLYINDVRHSRGDQSLKVEMLRK